jgi:hypothetical protein
VNHRRFITDIAGTPIIRILTGLVRTVGPVRRQVTQMAITRSLPQTRPLGGRPPRRFGSQQTPDAVLDLPGSATVSCLLMQDVIAADVVLVGSGYAPVALFANPFLDGQEEALIVDDQGMLTYLRRTGSDTGWEQAPVVGADGQAIAATEVVVVRHPQDLTFWAVYVARADGKPRALQLAGPQAGGELCTWEDWPDAVYMVPERPGLNTLSRLSVFYDGPTPHITAIDSVTNNIVSLIPRTGTGPLRFGCMVWWISAAKTGPVEQILGGRMTDLYVCYVRVGSNILRFDQPWNQPVKEGVTVATDAASLVGTFRSPALPDIGFVYLDKNQNLVTVNDNATNLSPARTRTAGLGLHTATCWVDVNQMMHVYGLDADNTLKVLHQAAWGGDGAPVWSAAVIRPVPLVPPHKATAAAAAEQSAQADPNSSVPSCIGLVPKVAMFVVDPFPDSLPTQLVKLEGIATPSDLFALHTQDVTSPRWTRDKIRLTPKAPAPHAVSRYVSSVTILDRRGTPMPGLPVDVSAESLVEIQADGASYLVGPGHSARLATNQLGRITIATSADSLLPAILHVDAPGLERGAVIQPAAAVHAYLAGSASLPSRCEGNGKPSSQQGFFTAEALRTAEADGVPIVDPKHHASLEGVVASTKNLFELADGGQPTSKLYRGVGAAPGIHGFAVGSAPGHLRATPDVTVGYTEFSSPAEVDKHLKGIRELPEYGGIWDDFTAWASDVWEGIKNGVVEVFEVVVEAVTSFFIWVGDKIVELVGFVVDSITTAVRAVEAVIREVVDAVVKVIDWLKALFKFSDIWDTKRALEGGLHLSLQYLATSISLYGDDLHGWFVKQEGKVEALFETLKDEFRTKPIGDAVNQLPAVADPSGQAVDPQDLRSNPQATWLLDQVFTPGAVGGAQLADFKIDIDPRLTKAWDDFVAKADDSKLVDDFSAVLGDLGVLLRQIVDPADPELAVKTSLTALIDILERLILIALKMADLALQALVTLIVTLVEFADVLLDTKLPLGPINTLYKWIQTEAGVAASAAEAEDLTIGGVVCLIAGFAVTTVYKLVNGVDQAPFPGGYFPLIAPPKWTAQTAGATAANDEPVDVAAMKRIKAASGIIVTLGSITNAAADVAPLYPDYFSPLGGCLVASMNALATTMAATAALPPVNGKPSDDVMARAAYTVTAVEAALQWGTLFMFMSGTCKRPALKNADENIVWGPIVTTIFGACQMAFHFESGLPNDYTKAMKALGAIPSLDQFLRIAIIADPETGLPRALATGVIDFLAGATSGLMLTVPAFIPGPGIPEQEVTKGKVDVKYEYRIERTGENAYNVPLKWTRTGPLPEGLDFDDVNGIVSGTPSKAETTECDFSFTDSYAPQQSAARTGFVFVIEP